MTAALLKPRKDMKRPPNVEALLEQKFRELIKEHELDVLNDEQIASIIKIARAANKIGYTNGYKRATMEGRK